MSDFFKKINIRKRIFLILYFVFIITITVSGIFYISTFYKMRESVAIYTITKEIKTLSSIFENQNYDTIKSLANNSQTKDGLRITLIDSKGNVVIDTEENPQLMEDHSKRPEIIQALNSEIGSTVRYSETIGETMVYVATKIKTKNNEVCVIRLSTSLPDLNSHIKPFVVLLILILVFVLVIILGVSIFTHSLISKPIQVLKDASTEWSGGNLAYRIPDLNDKDFELLAGTMNQMAEDIENMVERLKRLEKVRKDFVANVSHELRTPITLIKGFTETLAYDETLDKEHTREFLKIIDTNAGRMESIVQDLLTLSKLENDENIDDDFIPVEASFTVETCVELFKTKATKKKIKLSKHTESEIYALGNPGLLETALSNLIDNAIKYSPMSSEVIVRAKKENNNIVFSVENHCPPIPTEHLSRLFERFYRVDKARSKAVGGTGLGLAIVKHIAIGHSGHCSATSDDQATVFSLYIPAYKKEPI